MQKVLTAGTFLFAIALIILGGQQIVYGDFIQGPFIAPAWLASRSLWAYGSGAALVGAAIALLARKGTRIAAWVIALELLTMLAFFHLTNPGSVVTDGTVRTRALETLSLACIALVLTGPPLATAAVMVFAAGLVVFGAQHFMYAQFIKTLIPAWLGPQLVWTYVTGIAFIAAGASLLTGKASRWAATLLGVMLLSWVVVLHTPRVHREMHNPNELNSLAVAMAMGAGGLIIASRKGK